MALLALIAILIILPATLLGIISSWKVILLSISYFCFFLGTIWRVIRYGELVSRKEDRQVETKSGRIASLITVIGLIIAHWLTLFTFSLQSQVVNKNIDLFIIISSIFLISTAIIVSQLAIVTLGKFFDRLTIKVDHQLVTNGIYSLIRHPIYTSYILLFLGFCLMLQSLLGFSLLLTVCLIWFGKRINIEEKMLQEKFGEDYQYYSQKTKRLFPYIY